MTRSITPLVVGVDIEEVYMVFGEGLILAGIGLHPPLHEQVERKARRVRDGMLQLGCPVPLVRRFEAAASRIHRAGDPLPAGVDLPTFGQMVAETEREISRLMGEVRAHLAAGDGELYDVGVMLARLHLCLRVLTGGPTGDSPTVLARRQLYLKELTRVVPIAAQMVAAVRGQPGLGEDLEPELQHGLAALADQLGRWDGGSDGWQRSAIARADDVFASMGVMETRSPPSRETDGTGPGPKEEVLAHIRDLRYRLYQLFLSHDLANAEQGQRLLIEDCRRAIGPMHELTLAVRNDLALTLLFEGRGDLAADRAYDVADDAERALGARDQATAREQLRTLFVLMATKGFDESAQFYQSKLEWLANAEPSELDPQLRDTRQELLERIGRAGEGAR